MSYRCDSCTRTEQSDFHIKRHASSYSELQLKASREWVASYAWRELLDAFTVQNVHFWEIYRRRRYKGKNRSNEMKNLFFPFDHFYYPIQKKKKTLPIVISIYNIIQNIFWSKTYIRSFLLYISYSFSISYEIATLASREERKINGPSNWI